MGGSVKDAIHSDSDSKEEYDEEICDQISLVIEDWNGMKSIYSKESHKRKSRLNKDDFQTQHAMLVQLRERIYLVNDESKTEIPNNLDIDDYHNAPLTPTSKSKRLEKDSPLTPTSKSKKIEKELLPSEVEQKPLELDFDK